MRASILFLGNFNAIIWSGEVLQPQSVMVLQPMKLQLCLVAISLLSARPILDLLLTDIPDQVRVAIVAPVSNYKISSLSRQSFR